MKLHLPILLRRAVLAVMAALASSPAVAAEPIGGTDAKITRDKTYSDGVSMEGTASNRISGWSLYLVGGGAKVTATSGNITLTTVNGYNAIANDLALLSSGAQANAQKGNVIMDGPANVVAFGSTVTGQQIIMQNTGNQTIEIGKVASGLLGDLVGQYIPDDIAKVTGNFNIVQGSTVGNNNTALVTMDAATANLIVGGTTVQATDIELKGGASAIVNADLGNLLSFAGGYIGGNMDLNTLLEGGSKTTLNADNNINLGSQINVVCGGEGVELNAGNAANFTGAFNVVGGNTTIKAKEINLTPTDSASIKDLTGQLSGLPIDLSSITTKLEDLADQEFSASVIAGGAKLTAENDITTDGTAGILVNTKVTDLVGALTSMTGEENPSEMMILQDILASGTATTVTSTNGNIKLGSQFNLVHGGNLADSNAALTITAEKGAVNMQGTANVVSGNVEVVANGIKLTGERLPADMTGLVTGLAGSFADSLPGGADMMNKLIQKGNFNIVTGGATLTAGTGGITMNDVPVDSIDATGAINAVLDTELTDLITVVRHGEPSAILPKADGTLDDVTTTLSSGGDIDMLGRVNVIAGLRGNVDVDAVGDVEMQGSISMVAGNATVDAMKDININTDEADKYKMHFDAAELGGLPLPGELEGVLGNMGLVNAAVVAGGANLTAGGDITTGGTAGILLNTPMADVIKEFNPFSSTKNPSELEIVQSLLQKGTATTVHADGNINLGSQLNLVHGGGFTEDGANALTLSAGNSVKMGGTFNVVSGNTTVDAKGINMTGERLPADMAALGGIVGNLAGELIGGLPAAANGMLDKLVQKGAVNVVTGGATLTAGTDGITMSGEHETGAINAVLDTDLAGVLGAMTGDDTQAGVKDALIAGGSHQTTLKSEGNINMLGRVNVVNGGKVVLDAKGNVNLQGNASLISGGATVTGNSININTDESADYKLYFDSTELGGLVNADSPFAPIVNSISGIGVNAGIVAGGAKLTAQDSINMGGTLGLVVNTPLSAVMTRFESYLKHQQETYLLYELLQPGTATTVTSTNGSINVGAQFNLLHGGGFTETAGENALVVSAANGAVNVEGTFNVVSGNTQVTAQEITMTGEILPADMAGVAGGAVDGVVDSIVGELPAAADNLLDRLIAKGNANIVTGGATLTATGEKGITMRGAANAVIDTELVDVIDAFMQRDTKPLEDGGNHMTTLTSAGNIEMLGRLNVVNGAYVTLDAAKDVNLKGTLNVVSGKATVKGNNINIVGQQNVGLEWGELIPDKYAGYGELADKMGILDKVNGGVNGSVIAGGAKVTAENDININGMAGAVVDTTPGSVMEALQNMIGTPLLEGETEDTTLTAGGDINMNTRLNVVNGGKTLLDAGKDVNLGGTFNVVATNANVNAKGNINMTAKNKVGVDISPLLNGHYAELAEEMGMTDVLKNGVSSNVVTGGAKLNAKGDVVMSGVATAIADTTINNVIGAVKGEDLGSLMQGGRNTTTVTAKNDIKLESQLNVVNGGNSKNAGGVELNAGRDVIMSGDINVVNRATVKAGNNVGFGGDLSVVKYSDIDAATVSFTGKKAEITDVNFNTASVEVIGTALVNTAGSELAIKSLDVELGNIENLGILELDAAALAGSTLHNEGSITVNGALTLNSATLSFVADSNNSTLGSTAITLGDNGSIAGITTFSGNSSADMIAGVSFMLNYDALEFIDNTNEFAFELAIFQGATEDEWSMLKAAIADEELSLTLNNGYNVESINSLEVVYSENGGIVSLKGTASVPEPTTATLSLLALAALAARRRRQK